MKSFWTYAIKIGFGAGLLAVTLWWASPADLAATLTRVNATAGWAVLALVGQIVLAGERWRLLVAATGASIRIRDGIQIGFVASLSGQILPGGAGVEIARIGMGRLSGLSWRRLVSLAVLDRMLLMFALAVTAAWALFVVVPALRPWILAGAVAGAGIGALGLWLIVSGRLALLTRWRVLETAWGALRSGNARPSRFVWAVVIALFTPLNLALAAWILARSMQIDLSLIAAITWIPLVLAAATIPVSLGGWGVREAAAVALLSQAGLPASEAVALSISLGVASLIAALPGAFMMPTNWRRASAGS